MTRFFASFVIAGLALSSMTSKALAIAGGPFDNGLPSAQLESGGFYQAVMLLRNGNGFCYFTPEATFAPEQLDNPLVGINGRASLQNRSVIYYRGVTYVGSAFGLTDPEAGSLQCSINAGSELVSQSTQNQTQANFFNFNQNTVSVGNQIVASSRNFTVNGNWVARFSSTAPVRRFRGQGELAFLSPTSTDAIANLALQSYTNFISAINAFLSSANNGGNNFNTGLFSEAQNAIDNALTGLQPFLDNAGVDPAGDNAITEKIRVRGTFRFF
jgi:hypothetical protein